MARQLKTELAVYQLVLRHPQTPWLARVLLGMSVGYLLLPFDLIPDFIPILGQLDDLVIVPGLFYLGIKCVPAVVIDECRRQVADRTADQ
ncbi:YkvA family protein [Methylobacillus flagellatus]|uniref:DUF1232 domain-containing protein n=1 Tax=Methylobacillus flagellatus (strain ATCC 51484 / DSM 6875 / VKM B-1610 / KT) TaxID=265072 RepID=Q1GZ29_METFK|nr:DUF1232 domain-containing protein [Methylobacillus flagellatus]ABE50508.1 protein of unknown function DUF1232 [Methylobacillus flagellatus KT]